MRYDLPLMDWISLALHKKGLNETMEKIRRGKKLELVLASRETNRRYMAKILREEIEKQFKDSRRPVLEVVLNAIDAKPATYEGDYKISVKINSREAIVKDNGIGMSLDDVLKFLIIPFNTEKSGYEGIGKFGVGFFSTFNYALKRPKRSRIIVDTGDNGDNFKFEFYSTGNDVENLRMRISRKRKAKGTRTKIKQLFSKRKLKDYLQIHTKDIPSYKARIFAGKEELNHQKGDKWYSAPVEVDILGEKKIQEVGFKKDYHESAVALTSQGVRVKTVKTASGCIVAFPAAVQLVEGRDEFKIDENYRKSTQAFFRAVEAFVRDLRAKNNLDFNETFEIASVIGSLLSALEIKSIKEIPNLESILQVLVPGKKYVLLSSTEQRTLKPFLGDTVDQISFTANHQSSVYWREIFGGYQNLVREVMKPEMTMSPAEFRTRITENRKFFPNLELFARVITNLFVDGNKRKITSPYNEIAFVDLKEKNTQNPFFINPYAEEKDPKIVYLNMNHRYVTGKPDPLNAYSVISEYFMLPKIFPNREENPDDRENMIRNKLGKVIDAKDWWSTRNPFSNGVSSNAQNTGGSGI